MRSSIPLNYRDNVSECLEESENRLERVAGIEPALSAWKAGVIPLYDTRMGSIVAVWAGLSNHGAVALAGFPLVDEGIDYGLELAGLFKNLPLAHVAWALFEDTIQVR